MKATIDSRDGLSRGVPLPSGVAAWGTPMDQLDRAGTEEGDLHVEWPGEVFGLPAKLRLLLGSAKQPTYRFTVVFEDSPPAQDGFGEVKRQLESHLGPARDTGAVGTPRCSWTVGSTVVDLAVYTPSEFEDGFDALVLWVKKRTTLVGTAADKTPPRQRPSVVFLTTGGKLQCEVAAIADWDGFDKLVQFVEQHHGATVVSKNDEPGDRRWVLSIDGESVELWHEDDIGNTLVSTSRAANALVKRIGEDLRARLAPEAAADRAKLIDTGRKVMQGALEALNNPGAGARIEARRDARERRGELIIIGGRAASAKGAAEEVSISDVAELSYYLSARKGELDGNTLRFRLGRDASAPAVSARWDQARRRVEIEGEGRHATASLDDGGRLSSQAFERAVAELTA